MPLDLGPLTVDRSSPVPLYLQLGEVLGREITIGRLQPGDQLPAEPELAKHFGVSRSVIRQALTRLSEQGLVRRLHGAGTFVLKSEQRSWRVQDVSGFFRDEVERRGHDVASEVLRLEVDRMPAWASDLLDVPEGTHGVVLERLRSVDGAITVYDLNYLPRDFADALADLRDDPHGSLYERLEQHGFKVASGRRVVDSVIAGERFAELLQVAAWDPLLVIEGVDRDESGRPFDCYRTWVRPDRMKVEVEVTPTTGASTALHEPTLASASSKGASDDH